MASPARLTFFCELESEPLTALFDSPPVLEHLRGLGASVSLGLIDLSAERASVVRRLNAAGVPVIAWQLLPKTEGYWFNQGNVVQASAHYTDFQAWTRAHGLRWEGVGLDIEPDIHDLQRALSSPWRWVPALLPRLSRGALLKQSRAAYGALVERIHADGYRVDSYQLPFIVDERQAGSSLLERLTGVLDLEVDREVLMLYTSVLRPHGPGVMGSYGPHADSIGVGITGGGVDVPEITAVPPLTWEELSRDLLLARRWTEDLHVFSLEGCVQQDFLERLRDFDWTRAVEVSPKADWRLTWLRWGVGRLLRASTWVLR